MRKYDVIIERLETGEHWPDCPLKRDDLDEAGWKLVLDQAHHNLKDYMDAHDSIRSRGIDLMRVIIPLTTALFGYVAVSLQEGGFLQEIQFYAPALIGGTLLLFSVKSCSDLMGPQETYVSGESPDVMLTPELLDVDAKDRRAEMLFQQCLGYNAVIDYYAERNNISRRLLDEAISLARQSLYYAIGTYVVLYFIFSTSIKV